MVDHDDIEDNEDNENLLQGRYLSFSLSHENYGIGIEYVTEIVGMQKISAVPDLPDFIKGVMNLRGQVIPVMDVRLRFHLAPRPYDERTCVVVVKIQDLTMGLIVDSVNDVTAIPNESIVPAPRVGLNERARYIQGIGKVGSDVKLLLNLEPLLNAHAQSDLGHATPLQSNATTLQSNAAPLHKNAA